MKESSQPVYFAPRTHDLTLGELRRMLSDVLELPDSTIVRCKNSTPFQVFERIQELHGVEIFHTTGTINLPID